MRLEQRLSRHPRVLDVLHALRLARPHSHTRSDELALLREHARGARTAVEIGTHMGVSAVAIASAMDESGTLYCVDPWPAPGGRPNACWSIFRREAGRRRLLERIRFVRSLSVDAASAIPERLDFAFIDGDHGYEALRVDWDLVSPRIAAGAVVCLHDTIVPESEPLRTPGSVRFFNDVIARDRRYEIVDRCHSMSVLRRRP